MFSVELCIITYRDNVRFKVLFLCFLPTVTYCSLFILQDKCRFIEPSALGVNQPTPRSAEVKEIDLYLCFPSGTSLSVLGRTLPLLFFRSIEAYLGRGYPVFR